MEGGHGLRMKISASQREMCIHKYWICKCTCTCTVLHVINQLMRQGRAEQLQTRNILRTRQTLYQLSL